jgi:dipeptidyl-peptidase III
MRRWLFLLALLSCRSAPPPRAVSARPLPKTEPPARPRFAAQPARLLGEVSGAAVLALDAPSFSSLPRDQRLLAFQVSLAAARGSAVAYEQGDRHNLTVVRLLRGILSRPNASPKALLVPIRAYARAVWLARGLHDPRTGHKLVPPFTAADLRVAALAAKAAGADLGLISVEYARRTARGTDLPASATNLYDGVMLRDLPGFHEQSPLNSRLVKQNGALREQLFLLPASADALDAALLHSAPPQRALIEPLSSYLRRGGADSLQQADRAFLELAGPVDFFLGFEDLSADPRGRKGMFAGFVGLADPERTLALQPVAKAAPQLAQLLPVPLGSLRAPQAEALFLASAAGAPLPEALTLPLFVEERAHLGGKSIFFAAAGEAADELRGRAVAALAEPLLAEELARCLPQQRFAFTALRELVGRARLSPREPLLDGPALAEARADLVASLLGPLPRLRELGLLPDARCQELWPQFAATRLFTSIAGLDPGERIDGDGLRAQVLQLWWLSAKGALVDRREGGRHFLAVPDAARLRLAQGELLGLLQQIENHGDSARLSDLFERHASHPDARFLREMNQRLQEAGVPPKVALVAPRIEAVREGFAVVDARLVPVDDLDAAVLRDWAGL